MSSGVQRSRTMLSTTGNMCVIDKRLLLVSTTADAYACHCAAQLGLTAVCFRTESNNATADATLNSNNATTSATLKQ
jgi:hypothetical protein|eukprot:7531-Heterococcus_DN1.PRE.2